MPGQSRLIASGSVGVNDTVLCSPINDCIHYLQHSSSIINLLVAQELPKSLNLCPHFTASAAIVALSGLILPHSLLS